MDTHTHTHTQYIVISNFIYNEGNLPPHLSETREDSLDMETCA